MPDKISKRSGAAFVAIALLAGAVSLTPAASAASPRCGKLKGRDVLDRGLIKVVDRRYTMADGRRGHSYVACPKGDPGARQRRIKASRKGGKLLFLDTRGATLAVRDRASGAVTLHDAVVGTRRRLRSGGRDPVGRVLVAEAGEAAAVFRSGDASSLVGFDYDGTRYTLGTGDIPARSLRHRKLSGIAWTQDGARRTARLDEPAVACGDLAGESVRRTAEVNVVSFSYPSQFLAGELTGTTTRFRACALPDGPVRVLDSSMSGGGIQGGQFFSVLSSAGAFVLSELNIEDSSGDAPQALYAVHDLAAGRRVPIWGNENAGGPNTEVGDPIDLLVAAGGRAAGRFNAPFAGSGAPPVSVVGFDANGKPRVLDSGAAEEISPLSVDGTVLRWTNKGEPRTADLAAL